MKKGGIKVVVDTNWWIGFVIYRFKSQLTDLLINPSIHFVTSPELQREIFETLGQFGRTKIMKLPDFILELRRITH